MAMFVVKSIIIQIKGQVMDLSMDSSTTVNHDHLLQCMATFNPMD